MTKEEYSIKLAIITTSDADVSTKEQALISLQEQYLGAKRRAMALIEESSPDPIQGYD